MNCGSEGTPREAEFSVFRTGRGQWVVRSPRLRSALVFPEREQAVACACDLAITGCVEVRDHRGALLTLFDFGEDWNDTPTRFHGPSIFYESPDSLAHVAPDIEIPVLHR